RPQTTVSGRNRDGDQVVRNDPRRNARTAPTMDIERPQASSLLKRPLSPSPPAPATHSAPMVDSGEASTRWPPMFMAMAIASALEPGSAAASPGTIGRNAGRTTPDVLL